LVLYTLNTFCIYVEQLKEEKKEGRKEGIEGGREGEGKEKNS
jgi:hypothetical protein